MLRVLLSRLAASLRRRGLDDEFDDEVRAHLALLEERFINQGMEPEDAFYAARRQFGGVTKVQQEIRERRALPFDAVARDVRHAWRQLLHAKAFTASAGGMRPAKSR